MEVTKFRQGINLQPLSADPSSPIEGDVFMSDGTSRGKGLWIYKDAAWAKAGGGSGGLDTFLAEDFASNKASSFTTGQNATFDNGGTIGGAVADEEAAQIAGDRSIKYTTHATPGSSDNDFFYLSTITLDSKQKEQHIGLSFYYTWTGSDDLIEVVVYDDTNNTVLSSSLDLIKAASSPTRYTTSVYVPASCNALKVGFHHTGSSEASKVLTFDDVELSTNPFVYKNLIETSSVSAQGNAGESITTSTTDIAFAEVSDPRGAWSGSQYTVQSSSSVISISGGVFFTGSSSRVVHLYLNGSFYREIGEGASDTTHSFSYVSSIGELSEGDSLTIRVGSNGGTLSNNLIYHYITINEQWESEHVITPQVGLDSMVRLHTGNGHGSTNNKIRRFTTEVENFGTGITYTDSATLGATFTINKTGFYAISFNDYSSGAIWLGVSKNSTQLTTVIWSITAADRLGLVNTVAANTGNGFSWQGILNEGDVIRPHTDGASSGTTFVNFTISKIGFQSLAAIPTQQTCYIKDVKSSGTTGGTFTSGAWQTRDLNTVSGDSEIVSLSTNQFTLQPGKYEIEASAPAFRTDYHTAKIFNISTSLDGAIGTAEYSQSTTGGQTRSHIYYQVTITSSNIFEIRHRCSLTSGTTGFGLTGSFGVDTVYTQVKITKVR
jgi:hypothetical protein